MHPGIKEAVVIDREQHNEKYLCAYVVTGKTGDETNGKETLDASRLKKFLAQTLPQYMIPAGFVFLPRLPVTPNGKVDRESLPFPDEKAGKKIIAPRDKVEKKMVEF